MQKGGSLKDNEVSGDLIMHRRHLQIMILMFKLERTVVWVLKIHKIYQAVFVSFKKFCVIE